MKFTYKGAVITNEGVQERKLLIGGAEVKHFSSKQICSREGKTRCRKVVMLLTFSRQTFSPINHVAEFLRNNKGY